MLRKTSFFILFCSFLSIASAQWSRDVSVNLPVCEMAQNQENLLALPDGNGGSIILWTDHRNANVPATFAQRLDRNGAVLWEENGKKVGGGNFRGLSRAAVSDGKGGVYLTFPHANELKINHIDSAGTLRYSLPGLSIGPMADETDFRGLAMSGDSAVWVMFEGNGLPYLQRINENGDLAFSGNGLSLDKTNYTNPDFDLIPDDAGGIFLSWNNGNRDRMRIQHYNSGGQLRGTASLTESNVRVGLPVLAEDGEGGAMALWWRSASTSNTIEHLGIGRVNADGNWASDLSAQELFPLQNKNVANYQLLKGSADSFYAIWTFRENPGNDLTVWGQRLNHSGSRFWGDEGKNLLPAHISAFRQGGFVDELGHLWVAGGETSYSDDPSRLLVQQFIQDGSPVFESPVLASNNPSEKFNVRIVPGKKQGAILVWEDYRNQPQGQSRDIFAQFIQVDGFPGNPGWEPLLEPVVYPNPTADGISVRFPLAEAGQVEIKIINAMGQIILDDFLVYPVNGEKVVEYLPKWGAGLYWVRITTGGETYTRKVVRVR